MEGTIVVIAETDHGAVTPASLEAAAFAGRLGESLRLPVRLVLPGGMERSRAGAPGLPVTAIPGAAMAQYSSETWTMSLAPILQSRKAEFVVLAHSSRGADFAPGLAMRLRGSCVTAVESFRREGAAVVFSRPAWNGKLRMEVEPQALPAVVTVLPGAVKPAVPPRKDPAETEMEMEEIDAGAPAAGRIEPLGTIAAEPGGARLAEADVIVAAGKGMGSAENIGLIEELAGHFPHSAVAGSRAACDAGWVDHRLQIGQTGKTVAPKLYIACGISGAVQHLAGMRGALCTAAINRDPQAPIFRVADYGVVEDLTTFLPLLVEAIEKRKRRSPA